MKRCSDVMTGNPACCLPTDDAARAASLMKSENVGSIPVVESEQTRKLIGIVTDRDLALQIVADGRDKSTKVSELMTKNVVTCLADEDVQNALDAMADYRLRRIPVVDADNQIIGIISQADIATRVDQPEETAEVVKEISQPSA